MAPRGAAQNHTERCSTPSADQLRWTCPPDALSFETTEDMAPLEGFVGQDAAIEALRFGIECAAPSRTSSSAA